MIILWLLNNVLEESSRCGEAVDARIGFASQPHNARNHKGGELGKYKKKKTKKVNRWSQQNSNNCCN
jgi:hypothetical protein